MTSKIFLVLSLCAFCVSLSAGYASSGDLDNTFGTAGRVITIKPDSGGVGRSLAIQDDGKMIVAGDHAYGDFCLARYEANGLPDPSFGSGGQLLTDIGGYDDCRVVAVQADGKIVAAGRTHTPASYYDIALVRYHSNGTLDSSFGTGGKVITGIGPGSYEDCVGVKVLRDGKMVVVGTTNSGTGPGIIVLRYNPDGALDSTFGTGGMSIVDSSVAYPGLSASGMALQSDGRIVVVGSCDSLRLAVVRFQTTGALDPAFGDGGLVLTQLANGGQTVARSVTIQTDGKIVVGGDVAEDFAVLRYHPNGTLDSQFGSGGKALVHLGGRAVNGNSVRVQTDGRILLGGSSFVPGQNEVTCTFSLLRLESDGSIDGSFGTGGVQSTSFPGGSHCYANALAVQKNGQIILAGYSYGFYGGVNETAMFALARYNRGELTARSATYEQVASFPAGGSTTVGATPVYVGATRDATGSLWGTTMSGGANALGTVFKISPQGVLTTVVSFTGTAGAAKGAAPFTDLCLASDGNLYGTTSGGGAGGFGTLFKLTTSGVFTTLVEFTGTAGSNKGANPSAVIEGIDGLLYGVTSAGGAGNMGTVYKVGKSGGNVTPLAEFAGRTTAPRGSSPVGRLLRASDGNFYGTTYTGGNNDIAGGSGNGTIFKVTPGGVLTTLVEFSGTSGSWPGSRPAGHLHEAGDGMLYGTTSLGGASNKGTAFKVDKSGSFTSVCAFDGGVNGGGEVGSVLVPMPDGQFYGVSYGGGASGNGTLFRISSSGTVTTLGQFSGAGSGSFAGAHPRMLSYQADGNLYGTTEGGGPGGGGTVYRVRFGPAPATLAASGVGRDSAVLGSSVKPNGSASVARFEWGTQPDALINSTPILTLNADPAVQAAQYGLQGLALNTTYYYRVCAENADQFQPQYGEIQSFTTIPAAYDIWIAGYPGGNGAPPEADLDRDGLPNLAEYAFGLPPASGGSLNLPQPQRSGPDFEVSFTQPGAVSGITYGAQWSTTLQSDDWHSIPDTGSGLLHSFRVPIGSNTRLFVRLTVKLP